MLSSLFTREAGGQKNEEEDRGSDGLVTKVDESAEGVHW
jgi:hypothetical protein